MTFLRGCLLAAAAAGPSGARADTEETELRLKTAGVPDELRQKVHAAIERGTRYLLSKQRDDGAFEYSGGRDLPANTSGATALCGLALAHCGGADAMRGAQRALEYLAPDDEHARPSAVQATYAGGLTAMLVHALRTRPGTAEAILRNLCAGQSPTTGWWGYGNGGLERGAELGAFGLALVQNVNLSTTQYGALGLWAGSRACGKVPLGAWRLHLAGICATQQLDGSWSYAPRPGPTGYPNGTFMGLASLVLARAALTAELEDDPITAARAEVALRAGRRALDRDGPTALSSPGIDYYGLYALEKACVFLDTDEVGGLPWYVLGARRLLEDQLENGGWGGSRSFQAGVGTRTKRIAGDNVSTGFALLFLLRASETYHPTTPRTVNAPGPTTPSARDGAADGKPPHRVPPPPRPPRLAEASAAVDRVAKSVDYAERGGDGEDRRIEDALAAVDVIRRGLRVLDPDADPSSLPPAEALGAEETFLAAADAWRRRAGEALVDAVTARSPRLAMAAAQALSDAPLSASLSLRTRIDSTQRGGAGAPRARVEAAFRAIAAQGDPKSLVWLTGQVSTGRSPREVRTSRAALLALAQWRASSAVEMRTAALRLARRLEPMEKDSEKADPASALSWSARLHWNQLGPPALLALQNLSRDPDAPDEAAPPAPVTVAAVRERLEDARRR